MLGRSCENRQVYFVIAGLLLKEENFTSVTKGVQSNLLKQGDIGISSAVF
jgi:hypothetical protein